MSDRATLRRLLREHAEAVSTEIAFIKEDAILRLFDATQSEHDAQVAALQAALDAAINMNIEKNAEVVRLTIALAAANDLVHEQDVVYMGHYRTVQEIRKATEELFDFIEGHADRAFLAHAKALMEFRARIMPPDFPNRAAVDAHRARVGGAS